VIDPILDRAPCGFVTFADDGTMVEVNTTLADLLGYTRIELLGWHVQKILPPGGRIFYQTHVFPMLKLQAAVDEIYVSLRTKEGRDIPMLMNGVRRERGGAFANDCVFMRMLQRDAYEDQLLAARRFAEEANDAKAKFLSMMSHDLRTPLTTIFGHSRLLEARIHGPLNEDQLYAVTKVREAGQELMRMINDVLSFAKMEHGRVEVRAETVALADAIARAESLIRLRLDEAGLQFSGNGDGCSVRADPDRLQQILLNLLTNAIKFTPRGGRISVSAEGDGDRVRIHVRDTGFGIPADQLQRVFEPFVQLETERVDGDQRGVGLGLSISRDLARAMGGELTLESTVGEGSVFTIDLPAAAQSR
jgi:PAS domain S-box-containing protein